MSTVKLLAQSLLETCTLNQLKEAHGINFRFSSIDKRKFSLNYDMLEAKDSDPVASQCRGVVLYRCNDDSNFNENSVVGETTVLARTMPRFFNYGQGAAANVNFNNARFFEKLDGTMIAFYYDKFASKKWCTATRSVPDADLFIDGFDQFTFNSLFRKAIEETTNLNYNNWLEVEEPDPNYTYIFELCTPVNQVVVPHSKYRVYSIAILDNNSGEEFDVHAYGVSLRFIPKCESYSISNVDDMLSFVANMNGHEHEGLVVCDNNFNRVKVKNAQYLALSRINDSAAKSPRSLLELCLSGKLDDALPLLAEPVQAKACLFKEGIVEAFGAIDKAYLDCLDSAVVMVAENNWDPEKDLRKALALSVNNNSEAWMPYSMARFMGKANNMHSYVESCKEKDGSYPKGILEFLLEKINNV